jgi:hypothetical protein
VTILVACLGDSITAGSPGYDPDPAERARRGFSDNPQREAKELGLRVAIADLLPWNHGHPRAEPEIRRQHELVAAIAADESVTLLAFPDTLEDPDRPGLMKSELTSDGDHPSVEGYRRLGELAFTLP